MGMMPPTDPAPRAPTDDLECRELVELVTAYLEGALDASARGRVDAHLAGCDGCTTYLDQVRATVAAAGSLPAAAVPPALLQRLLAAFRAGRTGE